MCLFTQAPGCEIPLPFWLAVYFFILCIETITVEYRARMGDSPYYQYHRIRRNILKHGMVVVKEVFEALWVAYGITLYYSDGRESCADKSRGLVIIMGMFLALGVLKLVLFLVVVIIFVYITIRNKI